jgi:hypothetical protein
MFRLNEDMQNQNYSSNFFDGVQIFFLGGLSMKKNNILILMASLVMALLLVACGNDKPASTTSTESESKTKVAAEELSDSQIENIVRRSIQYVALYNVINKGAMQEENPIMTGWNGTFAATGLLDHTMQSIARPNNDTLYVISNLDLRNEPVIISYPAFDSKFVCLETSAYDHYCEIPLSTTKGDFKKPTRILYYTARTKSYSGEPVEGVDKLLEMTGDFVIAFLRVMPHASEPERMQRNLAAMQEVKVQTLSQYLNNEPKPADAVDFPPFSSDQGIFENNLLEVMQFVFNHTTFDPADKMDQAVLAAFEPLGVTPGKTYDPNAVVEIDGKKFAATHKKIFEESVAIMGNPEGNPYLYDLFKPKGEMTLEAMVQQSTTGPIGVPAHQAVYPPITTTDGQPMNAQHDYIIRMTKDTMPPAKAFWSTTLYDLKNGFFIPNDRKKYSVGENAGMKLNENGGIEIYVAEKKPEGVAEENWLPINRKDEALDIVMRIYAPDMDKIKKWTPPKAEIVK